MIVAKPKPDAPPPAITIEIDERWVREWVAYGFKEMNKYLGNHAEFDAYYEKRGAA